MTHKPDEKPREFWILDSVSTNLPQVYDYQPDHYTSKHNEHIHVIEMSAYRELEEKGKNLCVLAGNQMLQIKSIEAKLEKAIEYCSGHLDFMWASSIVAILLDCDFREAQKHVGEWRKKNEIQS